VVVLWLLAALAITPFLVDGIAVIIVDDKNVVVARTGWGNKLAS